MGERTALDGKRGFGPPSDREVKGFVSHRGKRTNESDGGRSQTGGGGKYLSSSGERFLQISPDQSINFNLAYTCNA